MPKSKVKRRFGCVVIVLMVLVLLGLGAVGLGRYLWNSQPDYWTENQTYTATDETSLTDTADRAFNRVLSELSNADGYLTHDGQVDPDVYGTRTIRLSFDEANAWLATRLDDWLVNQKRQLPLGVSDPMLSSAGDTLVAAFRYKSDAKQIDQVFSVLLSLKFLDDDRATFHVEGVRGGRLPLPTRMVLDQLPGLDKGDEQRSKVIAVLLGQEAFDPILPIDGTREARIVGMAVDDDGVSLTVQAEAVR